MAVVSILRHPRHGAGRRGLRFSQNRFEGPPGAILVQTLFQFLADDSGPTAVEYAVMLALIMVACISIVTSLGTSTSRTFTRVKGALGG
jgi:pilus assembly protein Flp/PilA